MTNAPELAEPGATDGLVRHIVDSVGSLARRDIGGVEYRVDEVTWPVSPNPDGSASFACPHTALTLVRDGAALLDVRKDYWDGNRTYAVVGEVLGRWMRFRIGSPGDRGWDIRLATPEERSAFVNEGGAVADAFGVVPG